MSSEGDVLARYLDTMRNAVIRTSDGLSDEQPCAAGVPSRTSLLGLVRHRTWVEEHWFQPVFLGEDPGWQDSMDVPAVAIDL